MENTNNIVEFEKIKKEAKEKQACKKDGKLLGEFKNYIKKDDSAANIIGFLAMKSAQLIEKYNDYEECLNGFSESEKEELYDFYSYLKENYDEKIEDARFEVWNGFQPVFLNIIEDLYDEDCEKRDIEFFNTLPEEIITEAKDLCEKIFAIRKDKFVCCLTSYDEWECEIPKTIPREFLEEYKNDFTRTCAKVVEEQGGVLIVFYYNEQGSKITMFGVTSENQKWKPISKEELKKEMSQKSNDVKVKYIEIEKD